MKKYVLLSSIVVMCLAVVFSGVTVRAEEDPLDVIQREIDTIKKEKEATENALSQAQQKEQQYHGALNTLGGQLAYAQLQLASTELEIRQKELEIEEIEAEVSQARLFLERAQRQFSTAVRQHYVENFVEKILFWLDAEDLDSWANTWVYRQFVSRKYQERVLASTEELSALEETEAQLNQQRQEFEEAKSTLEQRRVALNQQIASTRNALTTTQSQQQNLSSNLTGLNEKLAQLTAQQQAIVAARSGGAITGVGVVPTTGDFDATIAGFQQNAPANSFAVFSFGAFTHRNGMSQYGARARAESGQNAEQILSAYYPGTQIQHNYPAMNEITVDGNGTGSFEDWYLHRIYEVPSSWPKEVLKAQAIAARTYAIRRTNNGQHSICATESCQVFKPEPKGGAWAEAVEETRGMVLVDGGGNPVSTQYAAIHGGWTNTSGWDTTDGAGGSGNWTTNAWEVKANAPWFYKAWYREIIVPGRPNPHGTYSDLNSSCGRKPWMSQEEMSDIVNAYLLRQNPNGADTGRILPVTLNECPIYVSGGGKITGNPYSMSELRSFVANPVTNISSVQAINNNNGQTITVRFQTNRGTVEMSGGGFKETFNARAPGYLGIHQSGFAFFNIEHK